MDLKSLNARGIINEGNLARFKTVMEKAERKEPLTIGFIGGSITQGSLSSKPTTCYAYRVFEWWKNKFHTENFTYINAGIGATTSQFGVARVESDLLAYEPDVVFLEFSVNDDDTTKFQQTFEGCVRKILNAKKQPALFMFNNVQYDTGINAQRVHNEIGFYYELPIVSMKPSIYQDIVDGKINAPDVTPDNLHPNDAGHEIVAGVITNLLEQIYDKTKKLTDVLEYTVPRPYSQNAYADSKRMNNLNCNPVCNGFVKDEQKQEHITEIFRHGWTASKVGSSITFDVNGAMISVQYRKSIHQPAPIAKAMVDNDKEHAVILDANFKETWGDKLELEDILVAGNPGKHTLTITIIEAPDNVASEFYLTSVITA